MSEMIGKKILTHDTKYEFLKVLDKVAMDKDYGFGDAFICEANTSEIKVVRPMEIRGFYFELTQKEKDELRQKEFTEKNMKRIINDYGEDFKCIFKDEQVVSKQDIANYFYKKYNHDASFVNDLLKDCKSYKVLRYTIKGHLKEKHVAYEIMNWF